jgi:hypothetical protein
MSEKKLYQYKLDKMNENKINIPFNSREIASMPKGFTATSIRDLPVDLLPIHDKYIPINRKTEMYHKSRK